MHGWRAKQPNQTNRSKRLASNVSHYDEAAFACLLAREGMVLPLHTALISSAVSVSYSSSAVARRLCSRSCFASILLASSIANWSKHRNTHRHTHRQRERERGAQTRTDTESTRRRRTRRKIRSELSQWVMTVQASSGFGVAHLEESHDLRLNQSAGFIAEVLLILEHHGANLEVAQATK